MEKGGTSALARTLANSLVVREAIKGELPMRKGAVKMKEAAIEIDTDRGPYPAVTFNAN
jgi:hypothetical protein